MLALLLACAHSPEALRAPPADDVVYFAMVDRFADGDPRTPGAVDRADPAAFHGGDLQGIVKNLDYLQHLGVRTLWISPVFPMRDEKLNGHGAFHGYWTRGLSGVEPRFGTERDLRRLRRELSEREMRLVLDVVWNHVGYDAPLVRARPGWFHGEGDVQDWADPRERVRGDVHGLPDLRQEDEQVYRWLYDQTRTLVEEFRPDGLRIDAVRHMPLTFQARMGEELRRDVDERLWLLGEAFEGDPAKLAKIAQGGGFSAVFDFPLHYAMVDVFCEDRAPGRLAATLSQDRAYGALLQQSPNALVTFLDNHDTARVLSACGGEEARVRQALFFQFTARGTPSLTWGTEVGLAGAGEPENRADMRFEPEAGLTGLVRWLIQLRRQHPALTEGVTLHLALDNELYVSARVASREAALLVQNRGAAEAALPLPDELRALGLPLSGYGIGADGQTFALPSPLDPDEPVTVPARGALVVFFKPATEGAFDLLATRAWTPLPRAVELTVKRPLAEGERLLWVGAGAELGDWDPARGVPFDADGRARLTAPVGTVLAGKLVLRRADGSYAWEPGPDRYLLVPPGAEPLSVGAKWRD